MAMWRPSSRSAARSAEARSSSASSAVSVISSISDSAGTFRWASAATSSSRNPRSAHLEGRHVDAHRHGRPRRALAPPAGEVGQRAVEDPRAQRHDQPGLLGDVDEIARSHDAAPGMAPAHERLHAEDHATAEIDDRLVQQGERAQGDRPLQLGPYLEPVDRGQVQARLVAAPPPLAGSLRRVEGEVGLAEHLGGSARPGCRRHADAHRRGQAASDVERGDKGIDDARRDLLDLVCRARRPRSGSRTRPHRAAPRGRGDAGSR